jgi:hypothetical protein
MPSDGVADAGEGIGVDVGVANGTDAPGRGAAVGAVRGVGSMRGSLTAVGSGVRGPPRVEGA